MQRDATRRRHGGTWIDYSRRLNSELQARKVTEAERGFLLAAILVALCNEEFRRGYRGLPTARQLSDALLAAIRAEFAAAPLAADDRQGLWQAFAFLAHCPAVTDDVAFFAGLIDEIDENIHAVIRTGECRDPIGHFFVEFLRYANNDKGLGIVLTPPHVAELFAELAEVDRRSIVLDNCCGTGGLLLAAMSRMEGDAAGDSARDRPINNRQLLGIEYQTKIYALAVCSMLLHQVDSSGIQRRDCFDREPPSHGSGRPTVGLLNPPYKGKRMRGDREELEYVLNNLEQLAPGGRCVAIVPITCATAPSGAGARWKQALLERHTLEAVMSMPTELFHNSKTTVVTCTMVFTAQQPHPRGKPTWFAYWRDDGFEKTKHRGRVDLHDRWEGIRRDWVRAFRDRQEIAGSSMLREVSAGDEWCAEAYLEADYQAVDAPALEAAAKRYLLRSVTLGPGESQPDGSGR